MSTKRFTVRYTRAGGPVAIDWGNECVLALMPGSPVNEKNAENVAALLTEANAQRQAQRLLAEAYGLVTPPAGEAD